MSTTTTSTNNNNDKSPPEAEVKAQIEQMQARLWQRYEHQPHREGTRQVIFGESWMLKSFLRDANYDTERAMKRAITSFEHYRKHQFFTMDDAHFPREYHQMGSIFTYERDRFGHVTLYVRAKYCARIPDYIRGSLETFLQYKFYQALKQSQGDGMAAIVDFTDAGLSSIDLRLFYFLVTSYLKYTPYEVRYGLFYNQSPVLGFLTKLLKSLLPESMRKLVHVADKPEDLDHFIEPANRPPFMGGVCRRPFRDWLSKSLPFIQHPMSAALNEKQRTEEQEALNKKMDTSKADEEAENQSFGSD